MNFFPPPLRHQNDNHFHRRPKTELRFCIFDILAFHGQSIDRFNHLRRALGPQAVWCLLGGVKHHWMLVVKRKHPRKLTWNPLCFADVFPVPKEAFSGSMVNFGRVSSVRLKWSLHSVSLQSMQKLKGQRKWCKPFFSWQWWPSLTQSGSPWIFWKLQKRSFPKLRNRLPSDNKKPWK